MKAKRLKREGIIMIMSFLDCATLPDHIEQACGYKKGGFPSLAIVNDDHTITDWTNATQWANNIAAGKIRIINKVKANVPKPSPIKTDNPVACSSQQILDGFDNTVEWMDANVNSFNDDFYEKLNQKQAYVVMWAKDEGEIIVSPNVCSFTNSQLFPGSNAERQQYDGMAEFRTKPNTLWRRFTAPTGVFS